MFFWKQKVNLVDHHSLKFSVLRLLRNRWGIDLRPQRLQTWQDPAVAAVDESPYLRSRLHGRCHHSGCGCHSTEAQAVKRQQSKDNSLITEPYVVDE